MALECGRFGCPLGTLRTAEVEKSIVTPIDKVIYGVGLCAPILLGAFLFYSACFRRSWGKGKRYPVTLNMRLFAGVMGLFLLFTCTWELVRFLARYSR